MQFFIDNILLIFVLPLIAMAVAFVGKFFRFSFSRGTVVYSSITSTVIGLVYAVALYCYYHSGVVVEPFARFCVDNFLVDFNADKRCSSMVFGILYVRR